MDWQYWITTGIAVAALIISWTALKHSKSVSRINIAQQKRLEQLEHSPIVQVAVTPDIDRVKVTLTNSSPKNSISTYKIRFILRISVNHGRFSLEDESYTYTGGLLRPNDEIDIYPDEINKQIAHSLPILKNYSPDQYNFVLRAIAECTPPHPDSGKITKHGVGLFIYENNKLKLKPESADAV